MKDVRNTTPEDYGNREEKALSIDFGQIRVRIDRAPYQIPYGFPKNWSFDPINQGPLNKAGMLPCGPTIPPLVIVLKPGD